MIVKERITVKGTYHYDALVAFESGYLLSGAPVSLTPEPNNTYDPNAVEVRLTDFNAKLGYIPRELAPKYCSLILYDLIHECSVVYVQSNSEYSNIEVNILVRYEDIDDTVKQSKFWRSALNIPFVCGIYSIQCLENRKQYIGSSGNIKIRILGHIRDLAFNRHHNRELQDDFDNYGPDQFEAAILQRIDRHDHNLRSKEYEIINDLKSKIDLYNILDEEPNSLWIPRNRGTGVSVTEKWEREKFEQEWDIRRRKTAGIPLISEPIKHKSGCLPIIMLMCLLILIAYFVSCLT